MKTHEIKILPFELELFGLTKYNFDLFEKRIKFWDSMLYSTREDLSIDVSITIVGLISTKLELFLLSWLGQIHRQTDGQTDVISESSYGNISAHKKFQLKIRS